MNEEKLTSEQRADLVAYSILPKAASFVEAVEQLSQQTM